MKLLSPFNHVFLLVGMLLSKADAADGRTLVFGSPQERFERAPEWLESGAHELRILTPSILELFIVSEQDGGNGRPSFLDWIDETAQPPVVKESFPAPEALQVRSGGRELPILEISFVRRVLYAPLTDPGERFPVRLGNSLFLRLEGSVEENDQVEVQDSEGVLWPAGFHFSAPFDPDRWNPCLHVNQGGYPLGGPANRAFVGRWLGGMGELALPGEIFELIRMNDGEVVFRGNLEPRKDVGFLERPTPYQNVMIADFSSVMDPGDYQLRVPGMGRSWPFHLNRGANGVFARTWFAGLYHQRTGSALQGAVQALPFTRYEDGPDHVVPAEIPQGDNPFLFGPGAFLDRETEGVIVVADDVLPAFRPKQAAGTKIDVSGGHMDAGDYSKYTHNSALALHALMFGIDSLGLGGMDHLGVPESGDGIGDLLQEALFEADFLARMQDTDGGFFTAVLPKTRRFEADVLPAGSVDEQIVLPKSVTATAAALAALAEAGSSSAVTEHDPARALDFRRRAARAWDFLAEEAGVFDASGHLNEATHQDVFHYGQAFGLRDEMAWAAAAMFAAFGNGGGSVTTSRRNYETLLSLWLARPDIRSDSDELESVKNRWIFQKWRCLYEGFGAAARAYAFAERSGRRN
ncbi:MAG: glycoside hydrolase family 9 protein, partial [Verrucomicrobiota bacterium]